MRTKPSMGGAVEHDLVVHRLLDLGGRDGHVLELSEDVGKLEADEFHILFLRHGEDSVFRVF